LGGLEKLVQAGGILMGERNGAKLHGPHGKAAPEFASCSTAASIFMHGIAPKSMKSHSVWECWISSATHLSGNSHTTLHRFNR
jgi:hypothetical protein